MAIDFHPDLAVSNARVVVPNNVLLDDTGEQTWMAWITVESIAGGYRNIMADFSTSGLSLSLLGIGGSSYFPSFRSWNDGKVAAGFDNIRLLNSGWHHMVGTATVGGTLRLYIDGNLFAEREGAVVTNHTGVFTISDAGVNARFPGAIADVRRYNRTMELEEIKGIYGARGRDTNFESLIARWPLLENAPGTNPAGTIYDIGPYGLHGTATDITNTVYTATDVASRPFELITLPFTST